MQIIRNPKQFDVMLADNIFGDILSYLAGAISDSLGMLPSASFSSLKSAGHRCALYEPDHSSAPDIAGQNVANPVGAILSLAMVLEMSFNDHDGAELRRRAVRAVLAAGVRTPDIRGTATSAVSTTEMTEAVLHELRRQNER